MNFVQHGCLIGFVDDGRVEAVYCAFGGEPHVTGKILLEQYDSDDKAREIVGGGSMLSLATRAKGTFYDTMTSLPSSRRYGSRAEFYLDPDPSAEFGYLYERGAGWMSRCWHGDPPRVSPLSSLAPLGSKCRACATRVEVFGAPPECHGKVGQKFQESVGDRWDLI